jgi:hypothetical protein
LKSRSFGESRAARLAFTACLLLAASTVTAGPVSKWTDAKIAFEGHSKKQIFDIERCLLDWGRYGFPFIYRQPDRPDDAMLLFSSGTGVATGRIDLKHVDAGTHVRSWFPRNEIEQCL